MRASSDSDLIIAADGGYNVLSEAGIKPDILVGDLDSLSLNIIDLMPPDIEVLRHPREKDFTDAELAVMEAMGRGVDDVLLLGALGGRTDHTLANLALMAAHPESVRAQAPEGPVRCVTLAQPFRMDLPAGTLVSLSSWAGPVEGVTTSGLAHTLEDETLEMSGRGVENIADGPVEVCVRAGALIISVHSQNPSLLWE